MKSFRSGTCTNMAGEMGIPCLARTALSEVPVTNQLPGASTQKLFTRTRRAFWKEKHWNCCLFRSRTQVKIKQISSRLLHWEFFYFNFCAFSASTQVLSACDKGTISMAGCPFLEIAHWLQRWKSSRSSHALSLQYHSSPSRCGVRQCPLKRNVIRSALGGKS